MQHWNGYIPNRLTGQDYETITILHLSTPVCQRTANVALVKAQCACRHIGVSPGKTAIRHNRPDLTVFTNQPSQLDENQHHSSQRGHYWMVFHSSATAPLTPLPHNHRLDSGESLADKMHFHPEKQFATTPQKFPAALHPNPLPVFTIFVDPLQHLPIANRDRVTSKISGL